MNKIILFLENIFVYGIGGVIGKLIPIIMVPIVTRLMPETSYYGISDLSNTVASFGSAIAGLGLYDAMYRMFFDRDEEDYKRTVCSTTLNFAFISSVIVFVIMIFSKNIISSFFFGDEKYGYLVYITAFTTLVSATNNIIAAPTRMQNKRKTYLIMHTIGPLLSYLIAIILIVCGYYIIALPIGAVASALIMELSFYVLNRKWFIFGKIDVRLLKQLLIIGVPLLPNFLIYWVFNSSDKVMIVNLLSASASGIYSVGSKLGHASQLIYTAFAGGWQYFAFSTMNDDHQVESNSNIFEYLAAISFSSGMLMCALAKPIFQILFTGDYIQGYVVAPYLFLAPLLQMLFQVACNQFLVIKKTWPNMLILLTGAIVNIGINYTLIPVLGIEGAAIATLLGYTLSVIIGMIVLCKMNLMKASKRLVFISTITIVFFVIWRMIFRELWIVAFIVSSLMSLVIVYVYRTELRRIVSILRKRKDEKYDYAK